MKNQSGKILVFLTPVKAMNEEILEWVKENRDMQEVIVKTHKDDDSRYENQSIRDLYELLENAKEVITFSSGFAIEASCLGIEVTIPTLKSFVDMRVFGIGRSLEEHFTRLSDEEIRNVI